MAFLVKGHDTGLRMIEILKILLEGETDKRTIIDKLKLNNNIGNANTFEAYIKYFNTFEEAGLKLERTSSGAYKLKNALIGIDLTQEEKKVLAVLIKSIPRLNNLKQESDAVNLIKRLDKYIDFNSAPPLKQMEKLQEVHTPVINIVNTLKQIAADELEAEIAFKKRNGTLESLSGAVTDIIEENGRYYILLNSPFMRRNRRIYADLITSVKPLQQKAVQTENYSTVIYELYSRPAKSYKLKSWETLEDFGNNFIRIKNIKEDFETLFPRLLKYGENCRIVQPADAAAEILKLADDVLKNLEAEKCQEQH